MFERVAQLKQQYTDKYVVVDDTQPELARFKGITGQVKTVNMSGRALVQFDAWANIGWYDIDPAFLTVITEPLPKPEAKAEAPAKKAPAPKEKAAPTAKATPTAGAKPAAAKAPGKPSTADILAALRAGKGAAPASSQSSAGAPPAPAAKAPAAKTPTAKTSAAPGGAKPKLSTAEILAAARAKKEGAAAADASETAEPDAAEAEPATIDEATVAAASKPRKSAGGPVPTTVAEKVAWCREHDAK